MPMPGYIITLILSVLLLDVKTLVAEEILDERLIEQTYILTAPSKAMLYLNGKKVGLSPQVVALDHRLNKNHMIAALPLFDHQFRQDLYLSKGAAPAQLKIFMDIDNSTYTHNEKDGDQELMTTNRSPCETHTAPLPQIYFETNAFKLTAEQALALSNWACVLQQAQPDASLKIYGQADHRGSIASNFNLASKRAASVKNVLVKAGILATQIKSFAFGETQLQDAAHSNTQLHENRRTLIEVLGTD
jgi:outer membrane protein OmpA-like peptidoglycan-associated protein